MPDTRGSGTCKYDKVGCLFRMVRTKYENVSTVSERDICISVTPKHHFMCGTQEDLKDLGKCSMD